MKVNLRNDWVGWNGVLYRVKDNPHTFPDDWKLPKSAKAVEETVSYAELQKRQTKEHDPLAIDNSQKYDYPQPDDALLADVTPSKSAEAPADETKSGDDARRKELEAMTVAALHAHAKKENVTVETDDNKASLVDKILAHEAKK